MKVIFGYTPGAEIDSIYWKDPSTKTVTERVLRSDGVVVDKVLAQPLSWVMNNLASSHMLESIHIIRNDIWSRIRWGDICRDHSIGISLRMIGPIDVLHASFAHVRGPFAAFQP